MTPGLWRLFGTGPLDAVVIVARTVLLKALGGVVYGLLPWSPTP